MKAKLILFTVLYIFSLNLNAQKKGTMTDYRDNKKYKTIKIGEQIWMAENLAYKMEYKYTYNKKDGSKSYNNDERNASAYGYLYKQSDAKKACPYGWHLPSDNDWAILEMHLGAKRSEYNPQGGWVGNSNNIAHKLNAKDGFAVLYSGLYIYLSKNRDYSFNDINKGAYFWTSNHFSSYGQSGKGAARYIEKNRKGVYRYKTSENTYLSIRCIKDNE